MKKLINNEIVDCSEEDIAFKNSSDADWNSFDTKIFLLREKRNSLRKQTDWWASSDLTMTDEQTQYRQDLRDITNGLSTADEVDAVEFPTKPNE